MVAVTIIFPATVLASRTTINNIREGLHPGYTRIVFDCSGETPLRIGPAAADHMPVQFADLALKIDIDTLSGGLGGDVAKLERHDQPDGAEIRLRYTRPGSRVKQLLIPSKENALADYRLVLDIYPEPATATASATAVAAPATLAATPAPPATAVASVPAPEPMVAAASAESLENLAAPDPPAEKTRTTQGAQTGDSVPAESEQAIPDSDALGWVATGEASLILRASDVDGSTAQFDKYSDRTQPISGDLLLDAEKNRDTYLRGKATRIGQDDQFVGAEAGRYGKYAIDATWDKFIHRYAIDARTLYSGVGSGYMSLDDTLQADIESAPNSVEVANRLKSYLPSAAVGDPESTRDRRQLGFDLLALDPFTLRLDLGNEKREGVRPYAGAFNNSEMVALFQPIDYDTTEMKISGEYAQAPYVINVSYAYAQFENNENTLRYDNPLRVTDAVGGPSNGTSDLAPDNQYHNFAVSGALTQLPWRSQITANAGWGRMIQDDALVPFTSNTAITAPALPAERVDAQVNTSLYNFRLTSRPLSFMRVKGSFRYYDYDNRTGVIEFPDGYVETDSSLISTAVRNLPTSYTKTRAGGDIGFDVFSRSNLNLGYYYEKTERENREVAEQEDHIMKASLDARTLDWLDIRASYVRTQREIGDYRYDVYLDGGQDLMQLPQLRKYDQADLTRDFIEFMATAYSTDALALSGSAAYGTDDYHDSPYGLIEDNRYVFTLDADYAMDERLFVNLFYTHEIYENEQRARQNGGATEFDWQADGRDRVDSFGGGLKLALIPDHLDLDMVYAYSEVDGQLDFSSPSRSFDPFSAVDDSKTHMLNTKLVYHNTSFDFDVAVGYLWEKFDYSDLATEGFSYVPTDTAGNYQGALLSGIFPQDYDAHVVYTRITFRYR